MVLYQSGRSHSRDVASLPHQLLDPTFLGNRYTYTLTFIHVHPNFYTHTPLLIKLVRRHARCTRNKLAVL
jgi:hypothetical protein